MNKKWQIVIAVILVTVGVCGCVFPIMGRIAFSRYASAYTWRGDMIAGRMAATPQLDAQLVDDNDDSVPDRVVIGFPGGSTFYQDFGPNRNFRPPNAFHQGFDSWQSRPFNPVFGLLTVAGGVVNLGVLALLIGLGVVFFRRRNREAGSAGDLTKADLLAAMQKLGIQKLELAEDDETVSDDVDVEGE